jgi:LPPG:FO 2-phospho-L-lactate transferase
VCPDVDAVIYRLGGVFNDQAGYGLRDETFHVLEALHARGEHTWFRLGDRDLATHVLRTSLMRGGASLTEATLELCRRFDVDANVLPMCDEPVRTRFVTSRGELSFQEYFVRERLEPQLRAVEFRGLDAARPTARVARALDEADLVVIGPSNPVISIDPILRIVAPLLRRERTVAVTPIVGGVALKGPTVEMLRALGLEASPVAVARRYGAISETFVLDEADASLAPAIEHGGARVRILPTVMDDGGRALAAAMLS